MARYAIIEAGIVTNVIEAEADFAASIGAIQSDTAGIGWTYDDGEFSPPVAPDPGPNLSPLEPWRFWAMMKLTDNESVVRTYVDNLDDPQKSVASAMLEFSLEYRRDHQLVEAIRQLLSMDNEQLDALWDQGHQLVI